MSSKSRFIPQRWKSWQTVWTWPTKLRGGTGSARRVIFQVHALKSACTSFYRGLHNAYIPNTVKHQSLNRTVSYIFWRQNCHDKRKKEILVFLVPEGYFLNLYQQWSPVTWPPHQGLSLPCPQPSTPPFHPPWAQQPLPQGCSSTASLQFPPAPVPPSCPAPCWRWHGTGCKILPCCTEESPPLLVPTLGGRCSCCALTHRCITAATRQTKSHNQFSKKKPLASAIPGVVLQVSNFLCSVLMGMAP